MSRAQQNEIKELSAQNAALNSKIEKVQQKLDGARKRIKDLASVNNGKLNFDDYLNVAFNDIYTLLLNAVKIEGVPFYKENFIKRALFSRGQVGYVRSADVWAYVSGEGLNGYEFPLSGIFASAKGEITRGELSYEADGDKYLILANEVAYPLITTILVTCEFLATLDVGINQNAKAVRIPRYIAVSDDDDAAALKLSLMYANEQIEEGIPVIKISEQMGKALTNVQMNVELIADRLLELKQEIRNELLTRLGILTANSTKRERVQVGEVNAHVGECVDSIYVIIDCFNKQMQSYNLPFEMKLNGVIEDLYADGENEQPGDNEDEGYTKPNGDVDNN